MENFGEYERTFVLAEEDSTDNRGFVKPIKNRISMNAFKRLIMCLFKKETETHYCEINKLQKEIEDLQKNNKNLQNDIIELIKKYNGIIDNLNRFTTILEELNKSDKSEKARLLNAYRDGITAFCSINDDIYESFGSYARSKKLHILEKILNYLYSPTKNTKMEIDAEMGDYNINSDLKMWLKKIDEFGEKGRKDIEKYLETSNKHFEDCLIFPERHAFQKENMESRNGSDILEGEEIYIIKLGFDFPDSNTPRQKAVVFSKKEI